MSECKELPHFFCNGIIYYCMDVPQLAFIDRHLDCFQFLLYSVNNF